MRTKRTRRQALRWGAQTPVLVLSLLMLSAGHGRAQSKTIIDEWASVKAPKAPELKPVTLEPKTTALLILDMIKQTSNAQRRPRCLDTIPKVETLLKLARSKGLTVVYSITTAATPADVAKELAPLDGDPIVKAPADKFFRTD